MAALGNHQNVKARTTVKEIIQTDRGDKVDDCDLPSCVNTIQQAAHSGGVGEESKGVEGIHEGSTKQVEH